MTAHGTNRSSPPWRGRLVQPGERAGEEMHLSSQWDMGRRRSKASKVSLELGREGLPGVWRGAGTFAPCLPGIPGMPRSP